MTWLLQFIEEAYDARFKFEYSSWREGPPTGGKKNGRDRSTGADNGAIDHVEYTFEKVEQHRSPVDFHEFLHKYISTHFGLKSLVAKCVGTFAIPWNQPMMRRLCTTIIGKTPGT